MQSAASRPKQRFAYSSSQAASRLSSLFQKTWRLAIFPSLIQYTAQ
jgi:hypothetical protein